MTRTAHPADPEADSSVQGDGGGTGSELTADQAEARAREIADWLANRGRSVDPEVVTRKPLRSVRPLPPPDPRVAGIRSPGDESSEALREAIRGIHQQFLGRLEERWGGSDALDQLDLDPLPDEPFDWSTVPAEHHVIVEQVLALVDDACDTWFDREHRTACRRLLARVAGEPWVINRRGKVQTIAGAIVWTIASFNRSTGGRRRRGNIPASWLAHHLGLSSGSAFATRSIDIRIAAGIQLQGDGPEPIGEPGLIVSRQRRHAAYLRDKYRRDLA